MRAAQIKAFRDWLVARLPYNRDDPSSPITFPAENVYKGTQQDQPRTVLPVCTYFPLGGATTGGTSDRIHVKRAHEFTWRLDTNPAGVFALAVDRFFVPAALEALTTASLSITPGVDVDATVADVLTQLQALEGPTHVATYVANGTDAIDITAIDAMVGYPLRIVTDAADDMTSTLIRDVLEVWKRDLVTEMISIRIETKQSGEGLPEEAWAYQIASKLSEDAQNREGWDELSELGVGISSVSGPTPALATIGGSQGSEVASLTFELKVARYRGNPAGTIECVDSITGTIEASDDLSADIVIVP